MSTTRIQALCLLLGLLLTGGAAQAQVVENVVQDAPAAAPYAPYVAIEEEHYLPQPLEAYFEEHARSLQAGCGLTQEEQARAHALQDAYASGLRPAEDVLNKTEDVLVGVYRLGPADYDGERAYVILPGIPLTDEQLLSIVDAYARLWLPFDPAGLNERNCMRGGSLECTRVPTQGEIGRRTLLYEQYTRQGLRPQRAFTPLPEDDGLGEIQLRREPQSAEQQRERTFNGLEHFTFRPYREQTDEEILRFVQGHYATGAEDAIDYARLERLAREELTRLLNAPLSIVRTSDSAEADEAGEATAYQASFETVEANGHQEAYFIYLDARTGRTLTADWFVVKDPIQSDGEEHDPYDERWQEIARAFILDLHPQAQIVQTQALEPIRTRRSVDFDAGYSAQVRVTLATGETYHAEVLYQSGQVMLLSYRAAKT